MSYFTWKLELVLNILWMVVVSKKNLVQEEYWELGYNSMRFWDFPDLF